MKRVYKKIKNIFIVVVVIIVSFFISLFLSCTKAIKKNMAAEEKSSKSMDAETTITNVTKDTNKKVIDINETDQGHPIKRNLLE